MDLTLEDFVPYEKSSLWKIHDSYFAARGGAAWAMGEIPSMATSSYPMARQQAKLLIALVKALESERALDPASEVRLLEVGSGSGKFAAMLLRALERGCGQEGRALLPRIRYVLSDYSEANLRDAIAHRSLAPHVAAGRVVPAVLDLRRPSTLRGLDGAPVPGGFATVFANYVCCVATLRSVRKTPDGFFERRVKIGLEAELAPGETEEAAAARCLREVFQNATRPALMSALKISFDWSPIDLAAAFPDPVHRKAILEPIRPFAEATLQYPIAFFEFVRSLTKDVLPGGMLVVNDYGSAEATDLEGEIERRPAHYGNTLNHGVDFAVLESFCRSIGLAVERTHNPLFSVHTAAIRFGSDLSPELRKAFRKIHVRNEGGRTPSDLQPPAMAPAERGDHGSAARLLERCVRLDPDTPEFLFKLGECCFETGHARLALRHLKRGRRLDVDHKLDWDFLLGRVYVKLRKLEKARRAFERSVRHEDNPATQANLGRVLELLGKRQKAFKAFRRSLELSPDGPVAAVVIMHLVRDYLPDKAPVR